MYTKEATISPDTATMAEVAIQFPSSINILKKYSLDYCCGGDRRFMDVCQELGLDYQQVWDQVSSAAGERPSTGEINFSIWTDSLLIDYITQFHHAYVRQSIPRIKELLVKVCGAHGDHSPFLFTIKRNFDMLADDLLDHMEKEELILFPAMRERAGDDETDSILEMPIAQMIHEHDDAGLLIKSIRELSDNYTVPEYACPTFRVLYILLQEFDDDLMQHVHLENNILFKRFAVGA